MRISVLKLHHKICLNSLLACSIVIAQTARFPEPPRPAGLPAPPHVFKLGQNYPTARRKAVLPPWVKYNYRTQPRQYLKTVLSYVLEGNVGPGIAPEEEWPGTANKVRRWYNVPWANREYIHGLTQERTAECGQLLKSGQKYRYSSWGVAFYNDAGGYTIGTVFPSPEDYNANGINFPEGTVAVKVLFTTAPIDDISFLRGTREWTAFLPASPSPAVDKPGCPAYPPPCTAAGPGCVCAPLGKSVNCAQKVHLLQLDVAVKDSRATDTGWVFGTFVYNGQLHGNTPYDRLTPVGLAWGSDPPNVTPAGGLKQQYLFPNNPVLQLGAGGRLNGIIDDPTSWCLGCHSSAEAEPPNPPLTAQQILALGNIKCGVPMTSGGASLDYSLSIYDSIYNFLQAKQTLTPVDAKPGEIPVVKGRTGRPIAPIRR